MFELNDNKPQLTYKYMIALQRIYKAPTLLMHCKWLSFKRRMYLLKRWRDDRTRYLIENCNDMDYGKDRELEQILRCVRKMKALPARYE